MFKTAFRGITRFVALCAGLLAARVHVPASWHSLAHVYLDGVFASAAQATVDALAPYADAVLSTLTWLLDSLASKV